MPRGLLMMQNSFQWGTAEGQTLGIENAIRSNVRDLKIEGQTYQNLSNNIQYKGSGDWVNVYNISENGTYTFKSDKKGAYITLYDNDAIDLLKENSVYTLVFDIDTDFVNYKGICINGNGDGYFDQSTNIYLKDFNTTLTNGSYKFKFTMGSVTNMFAIGFRNTNIITGGTYFRAYNFKLLEGDYTNKDLPTYITGIESVAEREKGRNLLDLSTFIPVSNNVTTTSINGNIITVRGLTLGSVEAYTVPKANNLKVYLEENKTYSFSFKSDGFFGGTAGTDTVEIFFMLNGTIEKNYFNVIGQRTVTIPEGCSGDYYIRFDVNIGDKTHKFWDIQVKNIDEIDSYPIKIIHSNNETDGITLPNGVKNTIENGVHIKRVGKIILDGSRNWTRHSSLSFNDMSLFYFVNPNINKTSHIGISSKLPCYDIEERKNCIDNQKECIILSDNLTGLVQIILKDTSLETQDVAGLKKYLSAEPITLYHELATPITEPLTLTEIPLPQPLRSLPNGVCDEVVGNKLIQRVGVFNASKNYSSAKWMGSMSPFLEFDFMQGSNRQNDNVYCNTLPYKTMGYNSEHNEKGFSTQVGFRIKPFEEDNKTREEYETWLKENETIIYYELVNPIVHELNIPPISIAKGGNIITTANNITPNLSMKYKKSKK